MLRLHQHVSRQLSIVLAASILIFGVSSYFIFRHIEFERYENLLKTTIQTVSISISDESELRQYAKKFGENTTMRLSIINDSGKVIADSSADIELLENHNNRQEIMAAREGEFGVAVRYSDTLRSDFLNVAKMVMIKNEPYFIRVTTPIDFIMKRFYALWINVALIFILILLVSFFWAKRFGKKIKDEVTKLNAAFGALAEKNYSTDLTLGFALEFTQIEVYFKKLARKLEKKAKQKRKYTARIKLESRQKSDVISAISHEFKNPIASVIGYAQTLNDDESIDAEIRKKFLEKILKNSQKISDMIDRLALSVKLESGELPLRLEEFDLNSLVGDVVASFRVSEHSRTLNYKGERTVVKADLQMIEIAVSNLISNALKYSDDDIEVTLEGGVFSVSDKGIGIAADEIAKITEKFYRVDGRSWNNSLGLGLTFVSYILKTHGLDLSIKSVLGEGSTFSFSFAQK
jgi:signal transduction histidine kinase